MLEYLAYAFFGIVMIGCLLYVMGSLETEEATSSTPPDPDP